MDETCISSENITSAKKKQIQKIDTFLNDLMHGRFPGDVAVKEASKSWSNNACVGMVERMRSDLTSRSHSANGLPLSRIDA